MNNLNNRITFQELKTRVGIDDVAYQLGYRIDRRAGVGRYYEMVLGDTTGKRDTIIIKNTSTKDSQTYFRRDGSKGDVVTFIKENLDQFHEPGRNEWEKITNVLARMANMPISETREDLAQIHATSSREFNPDRYAVKDIDLSNIPMLFRQRGISVETVADFSPFVKLVSDKENVNFKGYNLGFPYTMPGNENTVGYEIRGFGGFKSKAAGTNSSEGAWVSYFSFVNNSDVINAYFFESAFDAMAFYQLNKLRLGQNDFALVSIGGTFSDQQVSGIMTRYPNARLVDCFDNDLAGRVNGLRMLSVVENMPIQISKLADGLRISTENKSFAIDLTKPVYDQIADNITITKGISKWTAPENYKDWNDCLIGKTITPAVSPSKYERDLNLEQRRKSSMTL